MGMNGDELVGSRIAPDRQHGPAPADVLKEFVVQTRRIVTEVDEVNE
jgi:hypothetical protein